MTTFDDTPAPDTRPYLIVAGPTAAGKSALALELARRLDGVIINADSLQIYRDLRILSARPSPTDEASVPHLLYGVLDGSEICSVGRWLDLARDAIAVVREEGRLPIFCGGTGLYLKAALTGLSPVPEISDAARREARDLLESLGPEGLHKRLEALDPAMADRLRPSDSQRLARAWEVRNSTGRSLMEWWRDPSVIPGVEGRAYTIALQPEMEVRRAACDRRLEAMLDHGALDELTLLLDRNLDPALPIMRAVGVPELTAYLRGDLPLSEALVRAQGATRRYAKRQATWIRHQMSPDVILPIRIDEGIQAQHPESIVAQIYNNLCDFLLTGTR